MANAHTFHVSVPQRMNSFIETRIKDKNYKSRGTYVQSLIRQDQLRAEKVKLTNTLLIGLASKQSSITSEEWGSLRNETMERIALKK